MAHVKGTVAERRTLRIYPATSLAFVAVPASVLSILAVLIGHPHGAWLLVLAGHTPLDVFLLAASRYLP